MGILSGAMGGLGSAVSEIATGHIKNEQNLDYQSQLMELQTQRDAAAEQRKERLRRDGSAYDFEEKVRRSPQEIEMEANKKRAVGDVENEQVREREGNRRIDDLVFKAENLGEMTKIEREMAQARDMDGEGRSLRNEATRVQIDEAKLNSSDKQLLRDLRAEYRKPGVTPERKAEIEADLIVLGSGGQHRYESKVIDDDSGNKRVTVVDRQSGEVIPGGRKKPGAPAAPETKIIDGKKYQRVAGGWQLTK